MFFWYSSHDHGRKYFVHVICMFNRNSKSKYLVRRINYHKAKGIKIVVYYK